MGSPGFFPCLGRERQGLSKDNRQERGEPRKCPVLLVAELAAASIGIWVAGAMEHFVELMDWAQGFQDQSQSLPLPGLWFAVKCAGSPCSDSSPSPHLVQALLSPKKPLRAVQFISAGESKRFHLITLSLVGIWESELQWRL